MTYRRFNLPYALHNSATVQAELVVDFVRVGPVQRSTFIKAVTTLVCPVGPGSFTQQLLQQLLGYGQLPMLYPLNWKFSCEDLAAVFPADVVTTVVNNFKLLGFHTAYGWQGKHYFRFAAMSGSSACDPTLRRLHYNEERHKQRLILPVLRKLAEEHMVPALSSRERDFRAELLRAATEKDVIRTRFSI